MGIIPNRIFFTNPHILSKSIWSITEPGADISVMLSSNGAWNKSYFTTEKQDYIIRFLLQKSLTRDLKLARVWKVLQFECPRCLVLERTWAWRFTRSSFSFHSPVSRLPRLFLFLFLGLLLPPPFSSSLPPVKNIGKTILEDLSPFCGATDTPVWISSDVCLRFQNQAWPLTCMVYRMCNSQIHLWSKSSSIRL